MAKKIDLKAYTYPARNLNYSAGDILRKVRQNKELGRISQSFGLVTQGIMEAIQVSGGYGWAISEYIPFSYAYTSRPIFTWGLDGTAGIDWSAGDNTYSQALPESLSTLTAEDYQPAIFIPRVIHWHIEDNIYFGCYLLVCQVNSECTEADKTVRIHFRFEGNGYIA
jgi:hypothetical protein